jgi:hypothetical protein
MALTESDLLIAFVVDRLPDSISERRAILNALRRVFPKADEPTHLIASLDAHVVAQRELALAYEAPGFARGSGRLGDHPLERGSGRLGDDSRERGIAKGGRR